jgi:hypothetical protein
MNRTIALIYMSDGEDYFLENPPNGDIQSWIGNVVNNPKDVEFVGIYELGDIALNSWNNPDCSSE